MSNHNQPHDLPQTAAPAAEHSSNLPNKLAASAAVIAALGGGALSAVEHVDSAEAQTPIHHIQKAPVAPAAQTSRVHESQLHKFKKPHHKPHQAVKHHTSYHRNKYSWPKWTQNINKHQPVVEQQPAVHQLKNLHPENLSITPEISAALRDNAAYIPALKCSGYVVRDAIGAPIGVTTADHCLTDLRHVDDDGVTTINSNYAMTVKTGDSMDNLHGVGEIKQFALPEASDMTHDQAIGAFDGHSIDEVRAAVEAEQTGDFAQGDIVYSGGWPISQPNNPLRRQDNPMVVLGNDTWTISNGKRLKVVVAAMPANADGTKCSPGSSGAEMLDGNGHRRGTQVSYGEDAEAMQYAQNKFDIDMTGFSAICSFVTETPPQAVTPVAVNAPSDFEFQLETEHAPPPKS